MTKNLFLLTLLSVATLGFAQKTKQNQQQAQTQSPNNYSNELEKSEVRKMIEDAAITRINKDWSNIAEFKSGIGETVNFYPVQVIDLKNGQKQEALQVDMYIKKGGANAVILGALALNPGLMSNDDYMSAWVGLDEIDEFIAFIEQSIVPNLDLRYKKKSSEFIFNAKEITFKYMVDEKRRRLSILLNNYQDRGYPFHFWTEARVDKIADLLPVLKDIRDKKLVFED